MKKTLYLNLEDDVAKVASQVKAQKADQVVLVVPKQSYLFADSINLRLLKKQLDVLGKDVSILTMDKKGQMYAEEAGFTLQYLPKVSKSSGVSDIRMSRPARVQQVAVEEPVIAPTPVKPMRRKVVKTLRTTTPVVVPSAPSISTAKIYKERRAVERPRMRAIEKVVEKPVEKLQPDNVYIPIEDDSGQAPRRKSYRKWVISFVVLAVILSIVLGLVVLPNAAVTVYARSQTVARDLEVIVDSGVTSVDAPRLTIPATKVEETRQLSNSFTANGKREVGSKAEGRVAIYNLTGSPLTLKAGTTVLTVGSKSYAFKVDQANITPLASATADSNATVADIIASEGGETYNLPAGTRMEISNQAFGSQPQRLYAKTVTQVIGGSSRFISILSAEDITRSQTELTKSVVSQINQGLSNNQALVDGAYTAEQQQFTTDKSEGTETTTFIASSTIKVQGLAFNEQALREMVRQRLLQTLGQDKELQEVGLDSIVYKIKNLDFEKGIMQLSIHYESKAMPLIDRQALLVQIAGKSKPEASDVILTNPDVDRVEITLNPSWQRSLPRFISKITLNIEK